MMPRMSGWELVKQVRSHSQLAFVPFIFLSALDSDEDRLYGFRLGADEYLPKPLDIGELALRVEVVLTRLAQLEQAARERVRRAPPKGAPACAATSTRSACPRCW
ncbi:response regulator transcription factor [Nannocystis pusilla]|uniref:response regulator transcription factor n=1 Tax=Nannocystis pusilla TaxID=889268 RepID=UPI003B7C3751